ncbi:HigA family addiction module antitoxin [Polaromonas sp. YR568]|jgi:addiction module HigA family antidote|uniref:HigA family addiction module antitoxin n=1 Tax=Polaromonas sp. YR568 TaxID=1855301 RepID=UPI003137AE11
MTTNGMRPVHPGEILREEFLIPLGMTPNALSKKLGVTATRINEIVKEERGITPETALRLARFFGGDAESWMNLQTTYDLKIAEKAVAKRIQKEVVPLSAAEDERFALAA